MLAPGPVARKQKQRLERSQGNQPEQGTDTMFAADLKPKVTTVGLATQVIVGCLVIELSVTCNTLHNPG
jgi:hypothetical protein